MKITGIDTLRPAHSDRKPMALEFAEHRVVVAHDPHRRGRRRARLHAGLRRRGRRVHPGLPRDAPRAAADRRGPAARGAPLGAHVPRRPRHQARRASPPTRSARSTSRSGTSSARRRGMPLFKLWGAVTDRVAAYGSGGWASYRVEDLIGEAQRYAALGCRYYKMKIHHPDPRANRQRVRGGEEGARRRRPPHGRRQPEARRARQHPPGRSCSRTWTSSGTRSRCSPTTSPACAEVARAIKIPVATGENNYTRFEFRELIERRAARYLMPDVCRANGFSETLKIGHLAAAHQVAGLAPRRPRAVAAGRRGAPERLPRRVHGLGAGRSLRGHARSAEDG